MQNCEVTQKDLTFDTNNKKKTLWTQPDIWRYLTDNPDHPKDTWCKNHSTDNKISEVWKKTLGNNKHTYVTSQPS